MKIAKNTTAKLQLKKRIILKVTNKSAMTNIKGNSTPNTWPTSLTGFAFAN